MSDASSRSIALRRAAASLVTPLVASLAAPPAAAGQAPPAAAEQAAPAPGHSILPEQEAYVRASERGRALVDSLLEALAFPGMAVAVAVDGEVVWAEGRGLADVERGVPVDARSVFPIYSVSKGLTGLALARLLERGEIDLDAPVQRYLPAFPAKPEGEITARLLAGHLAGIRHYAPEAGEGTALRHCEAAGEGLRFFADDALVHPPGTDFGYTSYGFVLLSALLAAAADRPFEEIMRREVFSPLGARSTYAKDLPEAHPRRVSLYEYRDDLGVVPARRMDRTCKMGAGAFASTAEDLARIASGMLDEGYLNEATRALILTPQRNAAGEPIVAGLGWDIGATPEGVDWLRRTGGNIDAWSALIALPESRVAVALLANMRGRDWIHDEAIRIGLEFARASAAVSAEPAARPAETRRAASRPLVLLNARIVDLDADTALPSRSLLIEDGRIAAIDSAGGLPIPPEARVVDVGGRYVLPGLMDMHVHVGTEAGPLYLANGVTGVRMMMGTEEELAARRDPLAADSAGVRVWLAGPLMAGTETPWPHVLVAGPEEARESVRAQARAGYDFVKVYDGLDAATYAAIVEEASRAGLPVVGHVPAGVGVEGVVAAGQRSIEHVEQIMYATFGREGVMTLPLARIQEAIEPLGGGGTFVVPTLAGQERIHRRGTPWHSAQFRRPELRWMDPSLEGWWSQGRDDPPDPAALERRRRFFLFQQELTAALAARGVPLLAGTDTPYPLMVPGFSLHHELRALVDAGLDPLEAVRAATRNPALFLGRGDDMGFVGVGALADLVITDGHPLRDVATLMRPWAVVSRGDLLERAELDGLLGDALP
jgi:CubicO group peptidase (beta-lactamase class C family)/imidazolonepropionase-like amidohydrolase